MNILSNDEMKSIQKNMINSYQMLQHKLKFNILQNFQQNDLNNEIIFKNVSSNVKSSIMKMVPLTKNLKTISLIEEQNSLFKVITYTFLLIIYKNENKINQYLKDQIKCSLYSEDINLLDVRNHSFNKKIKNDTIKILIAQFFKEFQYITSSSYFKSKNLSIDMVLQMALHKNDLVLQGFHLFFRTILWKLEVQNAQNCIQEVNAQEAISNLVEYFDVNCRIFNNLYLFNDDGIFISESQDGNLIFGDYYQNQAQFKETQQAKIQKNINFQIKNTNLNLNKIISKQNQIQREDIKIFNFMMDTDRNSQSQIQQNHFIQKNSQSETPHFVSEEEFAFGKKSDRPKKNSLDYSQAKTPSSNRFYNQHINQIQSEEQGYNMDQLNDAPTPFLGSKNHNSLFKQQKQFFQKEIQSNAPEKRLSQQKTFNFYIQNNEYFEQNDDAPTPVLGGHAANFFKFAKKQIVEQKDAISQYENRGSSKNALNRTVHQIQEQNQRQSENSRKMDRRHSVQYNKVDNKKGEMKTSKNQIKVIDQTASRTILLEDRNEEFQEFQQRTKQNRRAITQNFVEIHKQNKLIAGYDNISTPSSCSCCLQKKHKMKMQSKLFEIEICPKHNHQNSAFEINQQLQPNFQKKTNGFNISPKQTSNFLNESIQRKENFGNNPFINDKINIKVNNQEKVQKPRQSKIQISQQNNKKREEFIQFLKMDKKHLIKKISDKRQVKVNEPQHKQFQYKKQAKISDKKIIKQSMFVQPNYLTQNNNPQSRSKIQSFQNRFNNKSVTPTKKIDHSKSPIGKMFKKQNKIGQEKSTSILNSLNKPLNFKNKYSLNDNNSFNQNNNSSFTKVSRLGQKLQSQPFQPYHNPNKANHLMADNKIQKFKNAGVNKTFSTFNNNHTNKNFNNIPSIETTNYPRQFKPHNQSYENKNGNFSINYGNLNLNTNYNNTSSKNYCSNPTSPNSVSFMSGNTIKLSNENGYKFQFQNRSPNNGNIIMHSVGNGNMINNQISFIKNNNSRN